MINNILLDPDSGHVINAHGKKVLHYTQLFGKALHCVFIFDINE